MNVLLSVSLWLTLTMLACCAGNNEVVLNPDYMNATDYDTYSDDGASWNKASGIGQLNLVLLLGLAVLQIWN